MTNIYYEYINFLLKLFIYEIYNVHIICVSKVYIIKVKWLWYYGFNKCISMVCKFVMGLHALIILYK